MEVQPCNSRKTPKLSYVGGILSGCARSCQRSRSCWPAVRRWCRRTLTFRPGAARPNAAHLAKISTSLWTTPPAAASVRYRRGGIGRCSVVLVSSRAMVQGRVVAALATIPRRPRDSLDWTTHGTSTHMMRPFGAARHA